MRLFFSAIFNVQTKNRGKLLAKLIFFASVKDRVGRESLDLRLDEPTLLREVLLRAAKEVGVDENILINDSVMYAVNHERVDLDHKVIDSDEIAALPPMSGGV